MKRNKWLTPILAGLTAVLLLSGCENEKEKNMEAYRQYGINCMEQEDYDGALKAFQKALDQSNGKIGKKELDICYYKAEAQYRSGDSDAALGTYNSILSYDKNAADAYYLRGNLYYALGDGEKAAEDYQKAVSADKDNYELYIGIYESLAANGQESDGETYLNDALKIKGDKENDNLQKGRIYLLLNDYDHAKTCLQKALDAGNTDANFYLSQVSEATGDSDAADSYVQAYLDSGNVDSEDMYEIGKQQMDKGDYDHAVTYFEAGLAMDEVPNKQALMKKCIAAYDYKNDFESAKKMMADYVEAYPDDQDAAREYVFLQTR